MSKKNGKYLWLNGWKARLDKALPADGRLLSVRGLAERLAAGYTYLTLDDGTGAEIVKAEAFGNDVKITRGLDGTEAKAFPAGTCVRWEATRMGIRDTVCAADFECCKTVSDGCCGGEK